MPVSGIGGLFFRAKNPVALTQWYRNYFGVTMEGFEPWQQAAGPTVFMPFASDTDHWSAGKQWMLNLRVTDLDELLSKLRVAGIVVETNSAWDAPETGRFARIQDPEDNPIELWEPPVE